MTQTSSEALLAEGVHVWSVGAFGRAVARFFMAIRSGISITDLPDGQLPNPERWPASRIRIIAAWRPDHSTFQRLNDAAYKSGESFIPIVMDGHTLRVGPTVIPASSSQEKQGACYSCWADRLRQHASPSEHQMAAWHYYSEHAEAGPRGFIASAALIAAARASEIVDSIDSGVGVGGHLWELSLITRQITNTSMHGVHGCPRCGGHRPEESRSFAEMKEALSWIWATPE